MNYSSNKGLVNRYWKRPKPRVYECNIRDTERFYQQSYKDYVDAKEYAARKNASDDRIKISNDTLSKYGLRRANSLLESVSDPTKVDIYSGDNSQSTSRHYKDDALIGTSFNKSLSSTRDKSPGADMASIDERLQRIQTMRSELGIPSDSAERSSKLSFASKSSVTSGAMMNGDAYASDRDRRGRTLEATYPSRNRVADMMLDSSDDVLSNATEKKLRFSRNIAMEDSSSKFSDRKPLTNGRASSYARDDTDNYSYKKSYLKSERNQDIGDDDYSYKPSQSKKSAEFQSLKSSRKTPAFHDADIDDDDAILSQIKKKFPTSDQILERIRKMDAEI